MRNNLTLSLLLLGGLLATGCESESGSSLPLNEQLKQKDHILIIHQTKSSACALFADEFRDRDIAKDIIFDTPSEPLTCKYYDREAGDIEADDTPCAEVLLSDIELEDEADISVLEDESTACVLAGND